MSLCRTLFFIKFFIILIYNKFISEDSITNLCSLSLPYIGNLLMHFCTSIDVSMRGEQNGDDCHIMNLFLEFVYSLVHWFPYTRSGDSPARKRGTSGNVVHECIIVRSAFSVAITGDRSWS